MSDPQILVACLCAGWCGVCRDYARVFAQVQAQLAPVRFVWVDVEDQAELVDPVEVDDFPTLLIANAAQPHFFGPLPPQPGTLERIVRERGSAADASLAGRSDLVALVARIRAGM